MNLSQYVAYPQRRLAWQSAIGGLAAKGLRAPLRKRVAPGIQDLAALTDGFYADAGSLLADLQRASMSEWADTLRGYTDEYRALEDELAARYTAAGQLAFPVVWAVESGTAFLLYALVRMTQPDSVVEMGVGNGHSSFYLLRALAANGHGTLHSFDISPAVGGLVSTRERIGWDLRIVNEWTAGRTLVRHLEALPHADVSFHDASHGYLSQYFEFECLWDHLSDGGVLVCDDVDASHAFIDFCDSEKQPKILIDRRKAIGMVHRVAGSLPRRNGTTLQAPP